MQGVNISINANDRRSFEEEYWEWDKARPQPPGEIGHIGTMPPMHGVSPDGCCNYMSVPKPFLETLVAKGIYFYIETIM